jgi:spore germination cell wall hydrolase CwlJ-like protein
MRLVILYALLSVFTLTAAPVRAAYMPDEKLRAAEDPVLTVDPVLTAEPERERNLVAEAELWCMTAALYFEGGSSGESEYGQRHIARVILERARANREIWGGDTVCGVIFHRLSGVCQFSFACQPFARRLQKSKAWALSESIARGALADRNNEPPILISYYMNADLTPPRNACWFRRALVPVVKAGRHEFFREATPAERKQLSATQFDACTRYSASLGKAKWKKRFAKKGKYKQTFAKRLGKKKYLGRTRFARGLGGRSATR